MSARVLIRADGGPAVGAGHLMRSLALGHALALNSDVTFVLSPGSTVLARLVEQRGFSVVETPSRHPDRRDADMVAGLINGAAEHWVVADGYCFDDRYFARLRSAGARLAAIDDRPRLSLYDVDIVVDQNVGALRQPYPAPSSRLLLGPRFVLLQPELGDRRRLPRQAGDACRVLLTAGGSDSADVTDGILRALRQVKGIETTVVVGPMSTRGDAIVAAHGNTSGFTFVRGSFDLVPLMRAADLAIATVGVTLWELAYLGVPVLAISTNAVQSEIAAVAGEYGAIRWLGGAGSVTSEQIRENVTDLLVDEATRQEMSRLGRFLVDGGGARRVADAILGAPGAWRVRPAEVEDAEPIWEIASDPTVRRAAFNTATFSFPSHERWFRDRVTSADSHIWVIERDGAVGGFVRYDRTADGAAVNIAVATAMRGRGLATELLRKTWDLACRALGVVRARGLVLEDNAASSRAFVKADFVQCGVDEVGGRRCIVFERALGKSAGVPT
jgi:UDP-2,4-diacetamido-2,4,6-trideoxy-beta-L-altropyranose hydrolase